MENFLIERKIKDKTIFLERNFNLNEFFTEDELFNLLEAATPGNNTLNRNVEKNIKFNTPNFDKTKFILKLISSCKEKLIRLKEETLVKGLEWLANDMRDSILNRADLITLKKIKKENDELQTIFSWLEENSTIKIKQINGSNTKIKLKDLIGNTLENINIKNFPSISIKKLGNFSNNYDTSDEEINFEELKFINFSEDSIKSIGDPSFNIFKLESEVGIENILSTISCYIFTTMGFYSMIKYDKFEGFIQSIAKGYNRNNPYHNDLHAADILQTCTIFLKFGKMIERLRVNELDVCALLISTIIHDYKHPGLTNAFLINTCHPIAIKYNDISVLENYHIAESFKLIKSKEEYDIFSELSKENYKIMRKRIVECVLATDMTFHSKQFNFLKNKIETFSITKGQNSEHLFEGLDKNAEYSLQQEFLNIIIHICDISNPTKPFDIYSKWADRVMEEFYLQGDKERELNLNISFLCDRNKFPIPTAQIGFMDGVVAPFLTLFLDFFPELQFLSDNANNNKEIYKKIRDELEIK